MSTTLLSEFFVPSAPPAGTFLPESRPEAGVAETLDAAVGQAVNETGVRTRHAPFVAGLLPPDRAYPHLFDQAEPGGKVISLLAQARQDATIALDAFLAADLDTVNSQLTLIAGAAAGAQALADFNQHLSSIIAFIRRAALATSADVVSGPALNAMISALAQLIQNPALDLMQSAALANKLAIEGWDGEHQSVRRLIASLLDESEVEGVQQAELFRLLDNASSEGRV